VERPTVAAPPVPAPGRAGVALGIIVVCQLMLMLDMTIMNVALPNIQRSLGFSTANLQWVISAYTLTFGGLLLLGGRVGDIVGRRRMFILGLGVFTVASLLGGLAGNAEMLVATRALQGVGAAMAAPSMLALIATNTTEGPDRARALSLYTAASSAGGSIGLLVGGALTSWISWRWVLLVNVPIGIVLALLAWRFVNEPPRRPARLDIGGAVTATVGMAALVYGFINAADQGWDDATTVASFVLAVVLLVAFLAIEARVDQPLLPMELLRHRNRAGAYGGMLLLPAAMFAVLFFLVQFVQNVLGYSAVEAGLAVLPLTLMIFSARWTFPPLVAKFGPRTLLMASAVVITAGLVWLAQLAPDSSYAFVVGPLLLFGLGTGLAFTSLTVTILAGVPPKDSGVASGLLQAMQQLGGSLGLAILGSVFASAARDAAAGPPVGGSAAEMAQHVFTEGTAAALLGAAVFTAALFVVATFVIRRRPPA
jgi:EmrB/QacA subfamily drug resistance transporter